LSKEEGGLGIIPKMGYPILTKGGRRLRNNNTKNGVSYTY
jgi:hypothetical protein